MVGDRPTGSRAFRGCDRGDPAVAHQTIEQLSVVYYLAVHAKLRILIFQGVQAVCTRYDDLGCVGLLQGLRILHGQLLIDELVSGAPGGIARACFAVAEYGIAHPGNVQQLRDGTRGLLGTIFVRPRAAHPEEIVDVAEVLHVLADDRHWKREILGTVHAPSRTHVPWISLAFQAFENSIELGRELRGHHDLEAAHVEDVINMLDVHRALLHAGTGGGTRPQHVGGDDARHTVRDLDGP